MMISCWRRREAAILLATLWFASSIGNLDAEPTDAIERIKERVNQYFAAVQSNDITKAKQLVLDKSRNTFFPQVDSKLVGFRVAEVNIEKDNTAAVVRLFCQVMIPAAMQAVDVPQLQRWKLDSGEWYFDPADPPPSDASIMK